MGKIPLSQAVSGLMDFLGGEVDKIASPVDRFKMAFILSANPSGMIAKYVPVMKDIGVMDTDGNVCLDMLRDGLDAAFRKEPSFEALGFTFTAEDVPVLMRHLER